MPKLYTQEEVNKLIAEKLPSVRTKDLTDDEIKAVTDSVYGDTDVEEVNWWRINAARAVIAADREKNK